MISDQLLSVIVPAYKQEKTIKKDLENIDDVLKVGLKGQPYEIICVVDGKLDNTFQEAQKVNSKHVQVVGYEHNHGKGYAVRFGIARSKGELISFIDAGMEISPASIMMLMSHMEWYKADIIVGSKNHPVSKVRYPLKRRIYSWGYHFFIWIFFQLSLKDTQSGIKIFRRQVLEKIMPRLLVKRYAMDIEMLAVAYYLGFTRIYEAPIEVYFDQATSAISWRTIFRMLWDTLAVFYRLRVLKYYNDNKERNWTFDPELQFRVNTGR